MKNLLVALLVPLLILNSGCMAGLGSPRSSGGRGRTIDWQDPVSVVQGFFSAKRQGDWRTAYRCCDYDETLPKKERARIKKKWEEESVRWPLDYINVRWDITGQGYEGALAVVRIVVWRRDLITTEMKRAESYNEKLKAYKKGWKLINPLAAESSP